MAKVFRERFESFLKAQYNGMTYEELLAENVEQALQVEDAYYAGASTGFYHGFAADDEEAMAADRELKEFGANIIERYTSRGLR